MLGILIEWCGVVWSEASQGCDWLLATGWVDARSPAGGAVWCGAVG